MFLTKKSTLSGKQNEVCIQWFGSRHLKLYVVFLQPENFTFLAKEKLVIQELGTGGKQKQKISVNT